MRREQSKAQMLQDFETFCQQIETALANPTPELQQEVIRLLIDHIVVEEDAIVIKHIIPTDDDCRLLPGRRLTLMDADSICKSSAKICENLRPIQLVGLGGVSVQRVCHIEAFLAGIMGLEDFSTSPSTGAGPPGQVAGGQMPPARF
jgi:hypothetical protein